MFVTSPLKVDPPFVLDVIIEPSNPSITAAVAILLTLVPVNTRNFAEVEERPVLYLLIAACRSALGVGAAV